ncbi:MAG: HIT family hydrolase [Candidatus Thermofonsia Clade 1 bacterium]|uniref:HIT family hydrolase n=1 Tax=Candidatus Thermofonsia Clade 1 bacterium TaxID=2364210 RepID=A0A2M8P2V4_9CHLR|nr:MAG: HIT family hydrolase [Candidatus Thermofonsia Clade 1 bacterium]
MSNFDHLYTPWRYSYLSGEKKKPEVDCIFCAKVNADDEAELVVYRSTHVYVTLNLYPYNNGHLMIVPYAHLPSTEQLSPEALTDLMLTTNAALATLRHVYNPQAFNVGANLGEAAGAGVAGHFHLHIVPRWAGDTNFMSVVGSTRVIPDELVQTWRKLREAWQSSPNSS